MADNEVVIEINGNNLTDFINGSVDIKFDQFCNSFSFSNILIPSSGGTFTGKHKEFSGLENP